jgi:hypothetical protein
MKPFFLENPVAATADIGCRALVVFSGFIAE